MPKDSNRLNLDADLDSISGDFLKDVEAATKEVKARKQADAEKDRSKVIRSKDRRTSLVIVAAATIILILVAYWAVSAKQPESAPAAAVTAPQLNAPIATARTTTATGQRAAAPRLTPPTSASNKQPQRPPNEYDTEPM